MIVLAIYKMCEPFEYFCMGCGHLRLSFVEISSCSQCGKAIEIKGEPMELDAEALRSEYARKSASADAGI